MKVDFVESRIKFTQECLFQLSCSQNGLHTSVLSFSVSLASLPARFVSLAPVASIAVSFATCLALRTAPPVFTSTAVYSPASLNYVINMTNTFAGMRRDVSPDNSVAVPRLRDWRVVETWKRPVFPPVFCGETEREPTDLPERQLRLIRRLANHFGSPV